MNTISKKDSVLANGKEIQVFELSNGKNLKVKIINYGAIITHIEMADKEGNIENIVCGFDDFNDYISEKYLSSYPYFGSIIGRFGNRIANGHLEIEGVTYKMAINNGPNHLHGGLVGFDKRFWDAETFKEEGKAGVKLSYFSPDMEENYPGNCKVTCIYSLNDNGELAIEYFAETDKTTVVNLTNHTYFNLTGGKENILNHELLLKASKMTEMVNQIPTGKIIPVKNTPYDFTEFKSINRNMADLPTGYDDNFVLDNENGELIYMGCLRETKSGRNVEVYTTQPGVQLYSGYWIPEIEINGIKKFGSYSGVALETQHYPDSVHHSHFPSTLLNPGEKYYQKTIYKFLIA